MPVTYVTKPAITEPTLRIIGIVPEVRWIMIKLLENSASGVIVLFENILVYIIYIIRSN